MIHQAHRANIRELSSKNCLINESDRRRERSKVVHV